ncbi:MAG: response regulator transcription factor [Dehalogenimonas sp.]
MRVLLVEDDENLVWSVKTGLEENGYAVDWVSDGLSGHEMAQAYQYDLIILDIMLPKMDGFSICKAIRNNRNETPILMLTARHREDDRVKGLDCGADDYLVKPFSYPELHARVRALIRRSKNHCSPEIIIGDLVLNTTGKTVRYRAAEIILTPKEYAVLEFLAFNQGGIVTREMLQEHVWDCERGAFSNVIDVIISRIRKKLFPEDKEMIIRTVKGLGYIVENTKS